MIYLYWYLRIGAVFLAVIFISHQLTKSSADDRLRRAAAGRRPETRSMVVEAAEQCG